MDSFDIEMKRYQLHDEARLLDRACEVVETLEYREDGKAIEQFPSNGPGTDSEEPGE